MTGAEVGERTVHAADPPDAPWWRRAVVYQVYPRSFADSDGDGIGDLPGVTARLGHLAELGVDAVWLSPFYPSPQADAGYDVSDYRDVDPVFGTLADFDALLAGAHERGLRVIVDLVPNHTSDEHPWFRAALAAPAGGPQRDRYVFRDGVGDQPPTDWVSVFGGPAWTRVGDGQWYLHLFDVHQPDVNWDNPQVRTEFADVLRFWLDRGVDGFRVDAAHGLVKRVGAATGSAAPTDADVGEEAEDRPPMWDQEGVHDIYRDWRRLVDGYPGQRVLVAEAWVESPARLARYVRLDEMHQAFNFTYLQTPWRAEDLRAVVNGSLATADSVGAPTTWVLSNHDVVRAASRLGYPTCTVEHGGIGIGDPQPDPALGLTRARAATLLMLALPGAAYLYQGEELGLPDHTTLPDSARQDPTWRRSGHTVRGRDGCRVPVPWEADAPAYGFSPSGHSWLPQPAEWAEYALDRQRGVPGSTYELVRAALRLRREYGLGGGDLTWRSDRGVTFSNGEILVMANPGPDPVPLPDGARVLLSSEPVDGRTVPVDVTVWATTA